MAAPKLPGWDGALDVAAEGEGGSSPSNGSMALALLLLCYPSLYCCQLKEEKLAFFTAVFLLHPEIVEILEFVWLRTQGSNMSEVWAGFLRISEVALRWCSKAAPFQQCSDLTFP